MVRYKVAIENEKDYESQYNSWSNNITASVSYSYAAAALMAMDHFNNRDASIVPEISELDARCTIYFPEPTLTDSQADGSVSVRSLWDTSIESPTEENQFCAVLAPLLENANYELQPIVSALGIPMIVHHIESDLMSSDESIGTVTLSLSTTGRAQAMLEYLQGRDFIANWYPAEKQDIQLSEILERIGKQLGLELSPYMYKTYPTSKEEEDFSRQHLMYLKQTGVTTIVVSLKDASYLPGFAELLESLDMLSNEYFYILSPMLAPVGGSIRKLYGEHRQGSPIDKLLTGSLVFDRMDGFEGNKNEHPFFNAWRRQSEEQVTRLNKLVSLDWLYEAPDYFQTVSPEKGASFVYDAVISVGFAACKQQKYDQEEKNTNISDTDSSEDSFPVGFGPPEGFHLADNNELAETTVTASTSPENLSETKIANTNRRLQSELDGTFVGSLVSSSFEGASGTVSFGKEYQKGRDQDGIRVGAYNIRPVEVNPNNGLRSYEAVLTSTWTKASGWENILEEAFLYRDGSTMEPKVLRKVLKPNYITPSVRAIGLSLMVVALMIAFISIVLLGWLRKDPLIQRAQPFFMQILCTGSIIMSTSIITLSFDEGAGWSNDQLSLSCTFAPWLFFTGHVLMFCALFTKLWRVDRVLQFRRKAVTIRSALWPLVAFLAITISILVIQTIADPWVWERELIHVAPVETYGQCSSNFQWIWFGPLSGLIFISEILTMFFAWKTADVPEDFRDSRAVMYACFAQIQVWAVGIPMLAVLETSSADATYLGRIFLIWVFSVSSLVVVVGPKLFKTLAIRRNPQVLRRQGRVSITGLYQPGTSGMSNTPSDISKPSTISTGLPPARWFMDSFQLQSKASQTNSLDASSTGPPARWFLDSQDSINQSMEKGIQSQVETVRNNSTFSDEKQAPQTEEHNHQNRATSLLSRSRGLQRGNNLMEMSQRGTFFKVLGDIQEVRYFDEDDDDDMVNELVEISSYTSSSTS